MARFRTPLPDDLKQLIVLIRQGRLFEIQEWIKTGNRYRMPVEGNFAISPLQAAVDTGFHSLIEYLIPYCRDDEDLDYLLTKAVWDRRLDLIELLCKYGAKPETVHYDDASASGNPLILHWFEDHGVDLISENALASSLRRKHRAALGTYMRLKSKMPELLEQATMALRFHARKGDMKWVSLLLWAGCNPRTPVSDLEDSSDNDEKRSALQDAVKYGRVDVVKKMKLNRQLDDGDSLLSDSIIVASKEIIQMLLDLGADPNYGGNRSAVHHFVFLLQLRLEDDFLWDHDPNKYADILCLLASKGGRWRPAGPYEYRGLRRALGKSEKYVAVNILVKLMESRLFETHVFQELIRTPKMKALLNCGQAGTAKLREFAGGTENVGRKSKVRF